MHNSLKPIVVILALALPLLCQAAPPAVTTAAPAPPAPPAPSAPSAAAFPLTDAAQAEALRETDVKLAALSGVKVAEPKPAASKHKGKTGKKGKKGTKGKGKVHAGKRLVKAHLTRKSPNAARVAGKGPVVSRLSAAEVRGILSGTRDFSGKNLSGLNLSGMDLSRSKFNRTDLSKANLTRADLAETDLELADLRGADLRGASLNMARVRATRLEGARMEGAIWFDRTVCKSGSIGNCIE